MKPLELTVYPALPFSVRMAIRTASASPVPYLPIFHTLPPGFFEMKAKRLTAAECAAEYWRARSLAYMAFEATYPHHSEASHRWDAYKESERQELILRQFSTLPHYDEDVTP